MKPKKEKPEKDPFEKVRIALKKSKKKLESFPGVKAVGYGYKYKRKKRTKIPAVIISVGHKFDKKKLRASEKFPKMVYGIPVDVIEMHNCDHSFKITDQLQPSICGGLYIAPGRFSDAGGTLGAIVFDNVTNAPMGLTNHHVFFSGRRTSIKGDAIIQPAFKQMTNALTIGTFEKSSQNLDCAVFKLNNTRLIDAVPLNGIPGLINGVTDPVPDMKVKKSGAKTGVTFGIVDHVFDADFTIIPNPAKPARRNDICAPGDSGAIWITDDGNLAVGLHRAGSFGGDPPIEWGKANFISKVLTAMNIHF